MTPAPSVSVLMTTCNGAGTIAESIGSVLAQTFAAFELVVVDDGSTDGTPGILAACPDPRLRVIRAARNGGVVAARNLGFAEARGAYVAMLDHDDLAHPERLARQAAYLDRHPAVALLATEVELLEGGRRRAPDHQSGGDPLLLRWLLHIDNPFTWSSVMLRRDAVQRLGAFLRPEFELADDFDLYHRVLDVGDVARLEEALTVYRWHAHNTTHGNGAAQDRRAARVLAAAYRPWLGAEAEQAAALVVRHLSNRVPAADGAVLDRLGTALERLLDGFCAAHARSGQGPVRAAAGEAWWRLVRAAVRSGHPALLGRYAARPSLATGFRPPLLNRAESAAAGILRLASRRAPGRRAS